MSAPFASPGGGAATFPMPDDRRFPTVLIGFLALSLFAHAATFFLFQVTYPPHVTIPPQATQVSLLTPDTPEQQALLRWIEGEDPALVAASAHPVPASLFETPYRPSYAISRTAPRSMPVATEPPVRAPGPHLQALLKSASGNSNAPEGAGAQPQPTRWTYSGPLSTRQEIESAPLDLPTRSSIPLEETLLLLGVDSSGSVRYALVQRTSGSREADSAAMRGVGGFNFAAIAEADAALTWGFISISWGDGAYASPSSAK